MVKYEKADRERSEESLSLVFEVNFQALIYMKCSGVYNRDARRRILFQTSEPKTAIRSRRKGFALESSLDVLDHNLRGETSSQSQESANVMSIVP